MGLLTIGQPVDQSTGESETYKKEQIEFVHKKGIEQFIKLYHTFKDRNDDHFKYGDEVEFSMVKFDHKQKRVFLLLKAEKLMSQLNDKNNNNDSVRFMPEFGNFMLEGIPGSPYDHDIKSICKIETNMKLRRKRVQEFLEPSNEHIMTFTVFPLLGCKEFTWPHVNPTPGKGITSSLFFPDDVIYKGHPRYVASYLNNRIRRKENTFSNIPIYMDINTPKPFNEDFSKYGKETNMTNSKEDHIYLEGMGGLCSCLQVTFQAKNLNEARFLYDQFTPITPLMLALTASSPIWRGFLSEIDCRWQAISDSLDDRTREEKGEQSLEKKNASEDVRLIKKSRFDSVDCYLSENASSYNDIDFVKNNLYYKNLVDQGVDDLMAQHISHLFIRDPLIIFKEDLCETFAEQNPFQTNQFENIQSTNWQSMRFKPPPSSNPQSETGWRVEFRTMELQGTDFENAAFVTFLVLLSRAIIAFNLDFLIPISKVDENMKRAQRRDACLKEKFHFKSLFGGEDELTINEIMNGYNNLNGGFPGLIPIIKDYLTTIDIDITTHLKIMNYLKLVENKSNGKCKTTASWMRDFVKGHRKYKFDSVVSDEIAYDLMWELYQISNGLFDCPDLNGI